MHGMKDWPLYLFLFDLIIIGISFLVKARFVPIFTSFSYMFGFMVGLIFQTEGVDPGGGRTSNFWIIWTVVVVCAVISSVLGEMVGKEGKT